MQLKKNWVILRKTFSNDISLTDVPGQLYNFVLEHTYLPIQNIPVYSSQFINHLREGRLVVYGTLDTLPPSPQRTCLEIHATVIQDPNAIPPIVSIPRKVIQPKLKTVLEVLGNNYRLKGKAILTEEQEEQIIDSDDLVSEGIANFLLNK